MLAVKWCFVDFLGGAKIKIEGAAAIKPRVYCLLSTCLKHRVNSNTRLSRFRHLHSVWHRTI